MPPDADRLRFGTAGVPENTPQTSTLAAVKRVSELGLDGLEIEFVRGVRIGADSADKVREQAAALDIALSAHAPYYVNLNSPEPGKRLQSQEHLLRSARMARACGARSVVFHAGYYGADPPDKAFSTIKAGLVQVLSILRAERNTIRMRIETMGKASQFGSLDEVLTLCQEVEGLAPCLDFSHLHAREGKANTYLDFHRILRKLGKRLGKEALKDVHFHLSGIEYGLKGEIRHLNLADSDFRFDDWAAAVKDAGAAGLVICESPSRETDAVTLKNLYSAFKLKG